MKLVLLIFTVAVSTALLGCGGSDAPNSQPSTRQAQEARINTSYGRAKALERLINREEVEAMEAKFNGEKTRQRNLERFMAIQLRQMHRLLGKGEEIVAEARAEQRR